MQCGLFLLYHFCRIDAAYLPNLVADGEQGDAGDSEDGKDEIENEPGQAVADACVGG